MFLRVQRLIDLVTVEEVTNIHTSHIMVQMKRHLMQTQEVIFTTTHQLSRDIPDIPLAVGFLQSKNQRYMMPLLLPHQDIIIQAFPQGEPITRQDLPRVVYEHMGSHKLCQGSVG